MPDVRITAGMGLVALLLAFPGLLPPALASEEPGRTLLSTASELFAPTVDPSKLFKWSHEYETAIATEVLRESTIRKIGYGRTEFVHVVETASGTYSTDALQDPHVEYPGIHRKRARSDPGMAYWSNGHWVMQTPVAAHSFVTITRFDGGDLIVTDDGVCVTSSAGVVCN